VEPSTAPAAFDALPAAEGNGVTLVELDSFSIPFVQQDWTAWSAALAALERDWFAPALAALKTGRVGALAMTLCGDTGSTTLTATRGDLRRFWRHRALASLFE
jgi:hypothetical protein